MHFSFLTIIFAGSYDYFQFVQQWPPVTCRFSTRPRNQHRPLQIFTIHGLWPSNYSNPTMPSNCIGLQFKKENVVCIISFLVHAEFFFFSVPLKHLVLKNYMALEKKFSFFKKPGGL
uniref:S RNase n=1 Tax=Prunus dulcis TaxID=3755 RepID=A0A172S178_PRUDU|nr:S RNase [Prunus dulcis]